MLQLYRPIVFVCEARPVSFLPRLGCPDTVTVQSVSSHRSLLMLELEVTPQIIWGRFSGDAGIGGEM